MAMPKLAIYPDKKTVMQFATIISILMTCAMATVVPLFCYLISIFVIVFVFVVILSYSFKIVLTDFHLRIYQFFIPIATIKLNNIQNVAYMRCAKNGQGAALVITVEKNKERIFPVRLFGRQQVDNLISILTTRHL